MAAREAIAGANDKFRETTHADDAETPVFLGAALIRVAGVVLVILLGGITWLQCETAYQSLDDSLGPKRCLAEQLAAFHHSHWLHETALLGAARLRNMLHIYPAFDVAVLGSSTDIGVLAQRLEQECAFKLVQSEKDNDWTWSLVAKGRVFKISRFVESDDGKQLLHREAAAPNEVLQKSETLPTTPCAVDQAQFQCPHDEHAILSTVFGHDWRDAPLLSFL